MTGRGKRAGWRDERGINALEILIIVVVVCSVFGIGVPILHRGADAAVLDSNLQSLSAMVSEDVTSGYSAEYRPSGDGDPATYLSLALEQDLKNGSGYSNPFVGRGKGGSEVLNSHSLPGTDSTAPAVFITDLAECEYYNFVGGSPGVGKLLIGTLVVAFDSADTLIDVYFVGQNGQGSKAVMSVPTGPVRAGRHG